MVVTNKGLMPIVVKRILIVKYTHVNTRSLLK